MSVTRVCACEMQSVAENQADMNVDFSVICLGTAYSRDFQLFASCNVEPDITNKYLN